VAKREKGNSLKYENREKIRKKTILISWQWKQRVRYNSGEKRRGKEWREKQGYNGSQSSVEDHEDSLLHHH
jgi:hypothetical protein